MPGVHSVSKSSSALKQNADVSVAFDQLFLCVNHSTSRQLESEAEQSENPPIRGSLQHCHDYGQSETEMAGSISSIRGRGERGDCGPGPHNSSMNTAASLARAPSLLLKFCNQKQTNMEDILNTSQESQFTTGSNVRNIVEAMKRRSDLSSTLSSLNSTLLSSCISVISEEEENESITSSAGINNSTSVTVTTSTTSITETSSITSIPETNSNHIISGSNSNVQSVSQDEGTQEAKNILSAKCPSTNCPSVQSMSVKCCGENICQLPDHGKTRRRSRSKPETETKQANNVGKNSKSPSKKIKEVTLDFPRDGKELTKTRSTSKKRVKEATNDDCPDQKCTVLKDWVIKPMPACRGVCVEGQKEGFEDFWHSTAIVEVKRPKVIVTISGSVYKLKGRINKLCTVDSGFSKDIAKAFANGFPKNWRELIQEFYKNLEDSISIDAECSPLKSFKPQKGPAIKKPRKIESTKEHGLPQSVNSIWTPTGLIKQEMTQQELTVTKSGRVSLPPLAGWVGQRYKTVPGTNAIQVIFETDSAEKALSKEAWHVLQLSKRTQKMVNHNSLSKSLLVPCSSKSQLNNSKKHQTFNCPRKVGTNSIGESLKEKVETAVKNIGKTVTSPNSTRSKFIKGVAQAPKKSPQVILTDNISPRTKCGAHKKQKSISRPRQIKKAASRVTNSNSASKVTDVLSTSKNDSVFEIFADGHQKGTDEDSCFENDGGNSDNSVKNEMPHTLLKSRNKPKEQDEKLSLSQKERDSPRTKSSKKSKSNRTKQDSENCHVKRNTRRSVRKNSEENKGIVSAHMGAKKCLCCTENKKSLPDSKSKKKKDLTNTNSPSTRSTRASPLKARNSSTPPSSALANSSFILTAKSKSKQKTPDKAPLPSPSEEKTRLPQTRKRKVANVDDKGNESKKEHQPRKRRRVEEQLAVSDNSWTSQEKDLLQRALKEIDSAESHYWHRVAEIVETRSEGECQQFYQEYLEDKTKKRPRSSSNKANKRKKNGRQKGEPIRGGRGTLKRKQDLRDFLDEQNEGYEDNIFEGSPIITRKFAPSGFAVEFDKSDSDIFGANHDFFTPVPNRSIADTPGTRLRARLASAKKTPGDTKKTVTDTPVSVDRRGADRYIKTFIDRKKKKVAPVLAVSQVAQDSVDLGALPVRTIFTPASHPSIVVDGHRAGDDDDEEEDSPYMYYWNDDF